MRPVRLVHYNVQGCAGGFDPLLEQIRALAPDVACLNEVRKVQAHAFARALGKRVVWSGRWRHRIANAVLAPSIEASRAIAMPHTKELARRSAVSARWHGIDWVSVHLGLEAGERLRHLSIVLDSLGEQVVLAADLNEGPGGRVWSKIEERLVEAGPGDPTFPAAAPARRIDVVWCAPGIEVTEARVLEQGVSDHRGVVVDLLIPGDD